MPNPSYMLARVLEVLVYYKEKNSAIFNAKLCQLVPKSFDPLDFKYFFEEWFKLKTGGEMLVSWDNDMERIKRFYNFYSSSSHSSDYYIHDDRVKWCDILNPTTMEVYTMEVYDVILTKDVVLKDILIQLARQFISSNENSRWSLQQMYKAGFPLRWFWNEYPDLPPTTEAQLKSLLGSGYSQEEIVNAALNSLNTTYDLTSIFDLFTALPDRHAIKELSIPRKLIDQEFQSLLTYLQYNYDGFEFKNFGPNPLFSSHQRKQLEEVFASNQEKCRILGKQYSGLIEGQQKLNDLLSQLISSTKHKEQPELVAKEIKALCSKFFVNLEELESYKYPSSAEISKLMNTFSPTFRQVIDLFMSVEKASSVPSGEYYVAAWSIYKIFFKDDQELLDDIVSSYVKKMQLNCNGKLSSFEEILRVLYDAKKFSAKMDFLPFFRSVYCSYLHRVGEFILETSQLNIDDNQLCIFIKTAARLFQEADKEKLHDVIEHEAPILANKLYQAIKFYRQHHSDQGLNLNTLLQLCSGIFTCADFYLKSCPDAQKFGTNQNAILCEIYTKVLPILRELIDMRQPDIDDSDIFALITNIPPCFKRLPKNILKPPAEQRQLSYMFKDGTQIETIVLQLAKRYLRYHFSQLLEEYNKRYKQLSSSEQSCLLQLKKRFFKTMANVTSVTDLENGYNQECAYIETLNSIHSIPKDFRDKFIGMNTIFSKFYTYIILSDGSHW